MGSSSSGLKSSIIAKPALKKPVKSTLDEIKIPSRMYSDYMNNTNNDHYPSAKRKYQDYADTVQPEPEEEDDDNNVLIWSDIPAPKRVRTMDDARYGSSVQMSKKPSSMTISQKFSSRMDEQKKNVFNRLGDSMVSRTTNSYDPFTSESRNNSNNV